MHWAFALFGVALLALSKRHGLIPIGLMCAGAALILSGAADFGRTLSDCGTAPIAAPAPLDPSTPSFQPISDLVDL